MHFEKRMNERGKKRLIVALLAAPLVVALPSLWPHFGEPGFFARNADLLLVFFVLPYGAAAWLALSLNRRSH
jgi:hypothetical protein